MAPAPPPSGPNYEWVGTAHVDVGKVIDVGMTPAGRRRVVPILGGVVTGPIEGQILPGGADHQLVEADGLIRLEARYVIKARSGDLIYVVNSGVRHGPPDVIARQLAGEAVDPKLIYFRTSARFETPASHLQWITRSIVIGTAERHPDKVVVHFFALD